MPRRLGHVDDDGQILSLQVLEQLDPAAHLERRHTGRQSRPQPFDRVPARPVVAVGASEAHDQAHASLTFSFRECVAQLMHGS